MIGLLTTNSNFIGEDDNHAKLLVAALKKEGVDAQPVIWHNDSVAWEEFEIVLICSPWDYSEKLFEFKAWLNKTRQKTRILNAPDLIHWNIDKSYLLALARKNIDIVPSFISDNLDEITNSDLWKEDIVIKPSVSAGARNTGLFSSDDKNAKELAQKILLSGRKVVLQPEIKNIKTLGEKAIFFFDGSFSHSVSKKVMLAYGGGFLSGSQKEYLGPAKANPDEMNLAEKTLAAIKELAVENNMTKDARNPLYARLDIAPGKKKPLLLEAELFEPSYFFNLAPGAESRLARAVANRL